MMNVRRYLGPVRDGEFHDFRKKDQRCCFGSVRLPIGARECGHGISATLLNRRARAQKYILIYI